MSGDEGYCQIHGPATRILVQNLFEIRLAVTLSVPHNQSDGTVSLSVDSRNTNAGISQTILCLKGESKQQDYPPKTKGLWPKVH